MSGHLFIAPGDITQLSADAIAYSASHVLSPDGNLYSAFAANVPGFAPWYAALRQSQKLPLPTGSSFWLDLGKERTPHGVVVVVSAGGDPGQDQAGVAVRAALTTAARALREGARPKGRVLVGLPTFRLGKAGDRSKLLRSARAQVRAAVDSLAQLEEVDGVFITYTPTLHQLYLEARREVLGVPAKGESYPALESALRARECVLFVGGGLSSGAGLPSWGALIGRLASDLGIEGKDELDYLDVAQWYQDRFGRERLAEVVEELFSETPLPTLGHYLLMALPARYLVTTNYDNLLERALTAVKRHPVPVVHQPDVARAGQGGVFVVKLHGDVGHPQEIVLTRSDYEAFFERRPAMALWLEGTLLTQTFFFVGYGLRDPNYRQVYSRISRMLRAARRPAFATSFEAAGPSGAYLRRQWLNQQLHLIPVPGEDGEDKERQLLLFLDRLADRVGVEQSRLFLAPDARVADCLAPLRGLLDQTGAELESFIRQGHGESCPWADLHTAAEVLEFLTAHGWRPAHGQARNLCRLWEYLADHAPDRAERRRLLVHALGSAETFADAQRVRERLAGLDKH